MKIIDYFCNGQKIILNFVFLIIKYFFAGTIIVLTIIPRYFIIGLICIFSKKKRQEVRSKKKSVLSLIILILSLIIYFIAIFIGSRWLVQNLKNKYLASDIIASTKIIEKEENNNNNNNNNSNDDNPNTDIIDNNPQPNVEQPAKYYPNDYWNYINVPFLEVDFSELLRKNSDTVGWIKINGTNINYPIVQTNNNDYYLNHAFNKSSNAGGWVFGDFRDNFEDYKRNTIIYGHNMNNKTMFGSLPWLLKSNWQSNTENHYIRISTPTSNTVWRVFSVYIIPSEVYYLKTSFNNDTFTEFYTTLLGRSVYNFGVELTAEDKILTLSTCDDSGTKRMVAHAKMINIEYK